MRNKALFLWLNTPNRTFCKTCLTSLLFAATQYTIVCPYRLSAVRTKFDFFLQVWTKKGSSEKGRGQNSKLPPRFAKKQQQAAAAAAQQAQTQAQAQAQPPCTTQTPGQPQVSVQQQNQTAGGTASTEYTVSGKVLQNTQAHNGLGTELWENKVPPTAVLNDISKKCKWCLLDLRQGFGAL